MNKYDVLDMIKLGQQNPKLSGEDLLTLLFKIKPAVARFHSYCLRSCNDSGFNVDLLDKQEERIIKLFHDCLSVGCGVKIEEIQRDRRISETICVGEVKTNNFWVNKLIYLR